MQPSDSTLQGLPVLGHVDRVDGSPTLPSPNPSTPPHPRHVAGGVIGSFPAWQGIGLLLGMYPPEGSLKLSSLRPFSCAFSQCPAAKAKMVRTPWPCLCLATLGGTEKDPESSHFPLHGGSWGGSGGVTFGKAMPVQPPGITCPGTVSWPLHWQLLALPSPTCYWGEGCRWG